MNDEDLASWRPWVLAADRALATASELRSFGESHQLTPAQCVALANAGVLR